MREKTAVYNQTALVVLALQLSQESLCC